MAKSKIRELMDESGGVIKRDNLISNKKRLDQIERILADEKIGIAMIIALREILILSLRADPRNTRIKNLINRMNQKLNRSYQ